MTTKTNPKDQDPFLLLIDVYTALLQVQNIVGERMIKANAKGEKATVLEMTHLDRIIHTTRNDMAGAMYPFQRAFRPDVSFDTGPGRFGDNAGR